jgi:hypothetical protein
MCVCDSRNKIIFSSCNFTKAIREKLNFFLDYAKNLLRIWFLKNKLSSLFFNEQLLIFKKPPRESVTRRKITLNKK